MNTPLSNMGMLGKPHDSDRHTVALTFDLNRALLHLGPILDRLIENDGEPVAIWYGYTMYLDAAIDWMGPLPTQLPRIDDVLAEVDYECFGAAMGVQMVYSAFNNLYLNMSEELRYGQGAAKRPGYRAGYLIEGYWEEPMMFNHPMVIISTLGSLL